MSKESTEPGRMNILIVEDDPAVLTLIKAVLEKRGNTVMTANTATEGEELAIRNNLDAIILDLRLPDGNGYDICSNLRNNDIVTPVLFLSAVHETDVKIKCLNVGADDYLTKPFENDELLARIKAITRRSKNQAAKYELVCKELKVNIITRKFYINDEEIWLTNNEFNLLVYFLKNRDRIVSREELAKNVWDIHFDTQTNYINVYINYLRNKMRTNTENEYIETVRKKGFVLRCSED